MNETQNLPARRDDSWIEVLADVGTLARSLADTEFVPDALRGRPAAIAAAVLTGREIGVQPLTALAHIHVIRGKPGMSAQLMRQLIFAAGHDLRYVEATDTRCVVEGRRRGSQDWTKVTFTADQAKRAGINLGKYPEDLLVARATSRLARRVFADCLGGVPYLAEELEDGAGVGISPERGDAGPATPTPARRTVQRKPKPGPLQPPAPALDAGGEADTPHLDVEPAPTPAHPQPPVHDEPPLDDGDEPPLPATQPITPAQLRAVATAMGAIGYRDRDDRLRLTSLLIGRTITTGSDLTHTEASALLDTLARVQASDDPQARIVEVLEAAQLPLDGGGDE